MKFRTLVQAGLVIYLGMAVLVGWILFSTFDQVNNSNERSRLIEEIVQGVFEQSTLSSDYLVHRQERARTQWQAKHDSVTDLLLQARESIPDKEPQAILVEMRTDHTRIQTVFLELIAQDESGSDSDQEVAISEEFEARITAQLSLTSQRMVGQASRLSDISRTEVTSAQNRAAVY